MCHVAYSTMSHPHETSASNDRMLIICTTSSCVSIPYKQTAKLFLLLLFIALLIDAGMETRCLTLLICFMMHCHGRNLLSLRNKTKQTIYSILNFYIICQFKKERPHLAYFTFIAQTCSGVCLLQCAIKVKYVNKSAASPVY